AADPDPAMDAGNPGLLGLCPRARADEDAQGQGTASHPYPSHCPMTLILSRPQARTRPAAVAAHITVPVAAYAARIRVGARLTNRRARFFPAEPQLLRHSTCSNLERRRSPTSRLGCRQGKCQVYLGMHPPLGTRSKMGLAACRPHALSMRGAR